MGHKETELQPKDKKVKLNHVGGIADDAGGVDPEIDQNLIRLSEGP